MFLVSVEAIKGRLDPLDLELQMVVSHLIWVPAPRALQLSSRVFLEGTLPCSPGCIEFSEIRLPKPPKCC